MDVRWCLSVCLSVQTSWYCKFARNMGPCEPKGVSKQTQCDIWLSWPYCWDQDILEQTLHAFTCLHYRCRVGYTIFVLLRKCLVPQIFFSTPLKNIWSTASNLDSKSTTAFTFIHYLMNQRNFLRAHSNCISCNRPHIDREVTIIKRSGIIGDHRLSSPPSKVCQVNQIYGQVRTMYINK